MNFIGIFFIISFICIFPSEARTRKPIPAGRFEALTGIKTIEASNVNEIGVKGNESLWPKFNLLIKPQSIVYLSPKFTNLVFSSNLNIELTRQIPNSGSIDLAILNELTAQDQSLIKTVRKNGFLFIKTDSNFKSLMSVAMALGLTVHHYSKESGEIILEKE